MTPVERHVGRAVNGFVAAFVWLPLGAAVWAWMGWLGLACFAVAGLVSSAWDLWRAWKAASCR